MLFSNIDRAAHLAFGVIYFVAMFIIGIAILVQPEEPVIRAIVVFGLSSKLLACYFIVAALMNLYDGLKDRLFNPMWFAPIVLYMFFSWSVFIETHPQTSVVPTVLYTLLVGMYTVDYLRDKSRQERFEDLLN